MTATAAERRRVILAGVCALILTVGLARFAYTPMLPIMHHEAGLSHLAGGWLATVHYLGYMSGALLAASLSNPNLKFRLYRLGLVIAVLSTAAMGSTHHPLVWAGLRFASGFAGIAGLLLASGLVLNWLMRQGHRQELGLHFTGIGLGIAVSGLAVALMVDTLAWHQQWWVLGALGVVFLLPAWHWLPAPATAPSPGSLPAMHTQHPGRRWVGLLMATYFCAGFGFAIGATYTVAILVKLPLLAGHGNWVWVLVGIVAAPSCFAWDRIAQALGPIRALMWAFGLQTVSIILPAFSDGLILNVLGATLFGATFVGIVSLTLTLIGRHYPENPAKAMAKMTLSYGVAQIFAPAMAGYLTSASHSYQSTLLVTAVVMAGGLLCLQLLLRTDQPL